MKYCSQKWRDMSQVEKDEYLKEAKARRDNPELGRSREELITFHTKAIFRSVRNIILQKLVSFSLHITHK